MNVRRHHPFYGPITTLALAAALFAPLGQARDLAAGKAKAEEVCAACHGKDGVTTLDPSYPRLAGQHADYLLTTLQEYKSGSRKNAIMGAQAANLSRADMENLAAYYASLKGPLTNRR
ncbi:MAG: c-type cytochrome [Betaproteobacteria bacterium]|nr:cytochrome c [Betaproteobacteria bacterium]